MRFYSALPAVSAIVVAATLSTSANGQITAFLDTFDRANNNNISAETTGMSGTYLPVTYVETSDTLTGLPELTNITSNQLGLAIGPNASTVYPNVNFIKSGSTSMSVSLDIKTNLGGLNANTGANASWVGLGFGATQAQAAAAVLDQGSTAAAPGWKGHQNATTTNSGVADLYVAWERTGAAPDTAGRIAVWKNGVRTAVFDNGGANYTIGSTLDIDFSFSDFNAGTPVVASINYGGNFVGAASFAWDNANSNYIGITSRQTAGFIVDNFLVQFDTVAPVLPTLTINRDTGNISFKNTTSSPITLVGYTIQGENTAFNTTAWNQLDILDDGLNNNSWEMLTPDFPNGSGVPVNPATNLSEATLGAGFTVPASGTINFGNSWIRSPFEDFGTIEFYNAANNLVPLQVLVEGHNGVPFALGDFDFIDSGNNGTAIDAADWAILRSNLISDPAGAGLVTYGLGDINLDGVVDTADFDQFKLVFDAANGAGSFATMLSGAPVPEPGTLAMVAFTGIGLLLARSRRKAQLLCLALTTMGLATSASAQSNLFSDNYNRANSLVIDATSDGMSGTTSPLSYVDNGELLTLLAPEVANALNNVENNALHVADGPNASAYYLNHNFIESAITTHGVMSIKMDIVSNDGVGVGVQHFVGFGVGATLAQFTAQTQLDEGAQIATPALRGNVARPGSGFADLWVGWSPTNGGRIQVIKNGRLMQSIDDGFLNATNGTGYIQPNATLGTTGVLELRMSVDDFNAGTNVPATIYFNGVAVGGDVFQWDNTNANFVGFAARQSEAGFTVDNLAITTSTTPLEVATLSLEVNTETGEAFLIGGANDFTIDRYTIRSAGGLAAVQFNGIGGDSGLPLGNGSGNGWEKGGVQTSSLLSEFYLGSTGQGNSTLGSSFRASLGMIYTGTQDLKLEYRTTTGDTVTAIATYIASENLLGDFNGDGTVNLADYTVWRDNLGASEAGNVLNGNGNGGVVDATDYNLWKTNFGSSGGALSGLEASGAQSIPEPSAVSLVSLAALSSIVALRRRKQQP